MKTLHFLTAVVLSVIVLTSCKSSQPQQAQEHQEFYEKIQIGFDPVNVEQSAFEEMIGSEDDQASYNQEEKESIFGSYSNSNISESNDDEPQTRKRAVLNIDGTYTHNVGVSTYYSDDDPKSDTVVNREEKSQDAHKQEVAATTSSNSNSYTPYGKGNTAYQSQPAQPYQPSYTQQNTNVRNTDARNADVRNTNDYALNISSKARYDRQSVEPVDSKDYPRLKKYSVVVATLSQQYGVQALRHFFERDGISYFIVRNPSNLYYFIVDSHDSMELANKARIKFLIKHTTNQSQEEIWRRYYVPLTDTFILERR